MAKENNTRSFLFTSQWLDESNELMSAIPGLVFPSKGVRGCSLTKFCQDYFCDLADATKTVRFNHPQKFVPIQYLTRVGIQGIPYCREHAIYSPGGVFDLQGYYGTNLCKIQVLNPYSNYTHDKFQCCPPTEKSGVVSSLIVDSGGVCCFSPGDMYITHDLI